MSTLMTGDLLAVGTRKGLWLLHRPEEGATWQELSHHLLPREVTAINLAPGPAGPELLVGSLNDHWGPAVFRTADLGATWAENPEGAIAFPAGTGATLARVWQLVRDPADANVVWAGCEPASLWRSEDGGVSFALVRGLWDHPHRPSWQPGAGGQCLHTVLPDPQDGQHLMVAMSTGGVYASTDAGATWEPRNRGITASFSPDPYPEYGQCVHKVAADAAGGGIYYAQNHGGVFRTEDGGQSWASIAAGLPGDFGFTVQTHPHRSGTAWVVPLVADVMRVPPEGHLRTCRTVDGGATWSQAVTGLPDGAWTSVLRDAACTLDRGPDRAPLLAFGTRDGRVYVSDDEGDAFVEAAGHLPDVLCVRGLSVRGNG